MVPKIHKYLLEVSLEESKPKSGASCKIPVAVGLKWASRTLPCSSANDNLHTVISRIFQCLLLPPSMEAQAVHRVVYIAIRFNSSLPFLDPLYLDIRRTNGIALPG